MVDAGRGGAKGESEAAVLKLARFAQEIFGGLGVFCGDGDAALDGADAALDGGHVGVVGDRGKTGVAQEQEQKTQANGVIGGDDDFHEMIIGRFTRCA